ncbi:MAG: polysaccharide deacetylase family protein [Acidobacteria bacterium]|nr:polysaccharide deacetylase family protein [Acidobacteriota bacterium]
MSVPAPTSTRRGFVTVAAGAAVAAGCARLERPVAVLTFDDAVKSHRSFVAPILAQRGFNATFFVTHRWM